MRAGRLAARAGDGDAERRGFYYGQGFRAGARPPTPLSLPRPAMRLPFLLLLLVALAGCDETTGLDDDLDLVVSDAVAERDRGEYGRAVDLLEGALTRAPADPVVRVELATTLLQRDGLDLLDIDRIGRFLSQVADAGPTGSAQTASARASASGTASAGGAACSAADEPGAQPFELDAVEGFGEIVDKVETLTRAGELLEPVIPEALRSFDVCTSVVDGALVYDRAGAIAELEAQGLSRDQVTQALAVNALARFLGAYRFVSDVAEQATWYRMPDGSVVVCADDLDALRADADPAVRDLGQAVLSLDARASLVGSGSVAAEVVAVALDAYRQLERAVGQACR